VHAASLGRVRRVARDFDLDLRRRFRQRTVLAPVERPRTVVREELARIALVDRGCEAVRLVQVRRGGLAPDEVGLGLRNPRDVEQIWLDEFAYNADRDPVRHASSGTTGQSPSSWTK
jgi:hypothetical protein